MSKNEVTIVEPSVGSNLPVTQSDVRALKEQRLMLRDFVRSALTKDVDYGVIPGTVKNTLFKPGAEKLARLFGFGVRIHQVEKTIDRQDNFAMFSYRAEVYLLKDQTVIIAESEASCNSQEKKYKERNTYIDGKKVKEQTPIFDLLNTLQKMAQKRAVVGAVILAAGSSDFFTQDIDDPEDARQVGTQPEIKNVNAKVPEVVSATSEDQVDNICPNCSGYMMVSKYPNRETGNHDWYCAKCKCSKPRSA